MEAKTRQTLRTNPAAMSRISKDARTFGFAESELSRRLGIRNGEHTDKLAVLCWDDQAMIFFLLRKIAPEDMELNPLLTQQVYAKARQGFRALTASLIASGCVVGNNEASVRYRFFAASAG